MNLDDSVRTIKGIGEKTALHFEKLGIKTVMDLLTHYPKGYDLYEKPAPVNIFPGRFYNRGTLVEVVSEKNIDLPSHAVYNSRSVFCVFY